MNDIENIKSYWDEISKLTTERDVLLVMIAELKDLLAQPEQEPVAWMNDSGSCFLSDGNKYSENWIPLYTSLPKREPLSKQEYMRFFLDTYDNENPITDFVRAIEKAHGIGGEL